MDNTIIQQGRFTSTGASVRVPIRSDVDWMAVYNVTQAAASQTTAIGVKYYWQRGFPAGAKWSTLKSNSANAANLEAYATTLGFTLFDTSLQTVGSLNATITAISGAAIPVVSNSGTNGIAVGDVVRITNAVGGAQLGGIDFTVGYNTLTSGTFSLDYMPQIVASTTGDWRKINFQPLFYPRRRVITNITTASQAVVTLSVVHQYIVGQSIRMVVPDVFGMTEMDGILANIVAVDETPTTGNTITIDVDSSAFTTFAFPLTAISPFTPAETVPVGEDTSSALALGADILADATVNRGSIGMMLQGGSSCPAGADNDVIYWVAGKSFGVDNL